MEIARSYGGKPISIPFRAPPELSDHQNTQNFTPGSIFRVPGPRKPPKGPKKATHEIQKKQKHPQFSNFIPLAHLHIFSESQATHEIRKKQKNPQFSNFIPLAHLHIFPESPAVAWRFEGRPTPAHQIMSWPLDLPPSYSEIIKFAVVILFFIKILYKQVAVSYNFNNNNNNNNKIQ